MDDIKKLAGSMGGRHASKGAPYYNGDVFQKHPAVGSQSSIEDRTD